MDDHEVHRMNERFKCGTLPKLNIRHKRMLDANSNDIFSRNRPYQHFVCLFEMVLVINHLSSVLFDGIINCQNLGRYTVARELRLNVQKRRPRIGPIYWGKYVACLMKMAWRRKSSICLYTTTISKPI